MAQVLTLWKDDITQLLMTISDLLTTVPYFLLLLIAAFLVYGSVACLIRVKRKWWSRGLLFFGSWLIISMIIFMGDFVNLPPTLLIFMGSVWFGCEGSGLKRLTIGLMMASTIFAFNGFHDNIIATLIYYSGLYRIPVIDMYENSLLRCLFALALYLGIRHHRPETDFELGRELWKLLLMLALPPIGIVISMILLRSPFYTYSTSVGRGTIMADAALFVVAVLSFVGLLGAVLVLERQQKLEREHVLAEQNRKYYEAMEGQQFEIRRLKHDLANHLQVLLALPEERRTGYIEEMLDNPAFTRVLAYSGDATVNAVLTAKESLMRQKGISFYAKADIPEELPFEKADICALFANGLDNAVEACEKLPEAEREVNLTARTGKGMLAVCVKNPYAVGAAEEQDAGRKGNTAQEQGETVAKTILRTTKKDAANHGYGLRSIREVVKKYDGNMEIEREEGQFTLFCYLPLLQNNTRPIR